MWASSAARMPCAFLQVSIVMVIETVKMALMSRTARVLLAQGISFCAPTEAQGGFLDAFNVHHCVMARRTVRIQQTRKQHVVSVRIFFLVFKII
jgi:hypothetical protein